MLVFALDGLIFLHHLALVCLLLLLRGVIVLLGFFFLGLLLFFVVAISCILVSGFWLSLSFSFLVFFCLGLLFLFFLFLLFLDFRVSLLLLGFRGFLQFLRFDLGCDLRLALLSLGRFLWWFLFLGLFLFLTTCKEGIDVYNILQESPLGLVSSMRHVLIFYFLGGCHRYRVFGLQLILDFCFNLNEIRAHLLFRKLRRFLS